MKSVIKLKIYNNRLILTAKTRPRKDEQKKKYCARYFGLKNKPSMRAVFWPHLFFSLFFAVRIRLLLYIFVHIPLLIQIFAADPAPPAIGL